MGLTGDQNPMHESHPDGWVDPYRGRPIMGPSRQERDEEIATLLKRIAERLDRIDSTLDSLRPRRPTF